MSGRAISPAGATLLKQAATRTCRCWKVTKKDAAPFGLTSLDRDVVLDDGFGEIKYRAHRGYTPYANDASADLSVDNSEMQVLIAEFDMDGITLAAINRGDYDDAQFVEYLVSYIDPAYVIAMLSSGTLGKVKQIDNIECFPELRSLTQTLKQKAIIEKGSVGCRVVNFGDERCKYPVETELDGLEVSDVGLESDRTFSIVGSGIISQDDYYRPGVVQFFTGANAGRTYEIESYEVSSSGQQVTFSIPTENPIEVGDTGQIRRDCTRQWSGHNSCETYNNRLNFRGEPWRPVADSTGLMAPGAGSSGGGTDIQSSAE